MPLRWGGDVKKSYRGRWSKTAQHSNYIKFCAANAHVKIVNTRTKKSLLIYERGYSK